MNKIEFKKWCMDNGYITTETDNVIKVYKNHGNVLIIDNNQVNKINTMRLADVPTELFDKAVEYAKTPIEEREEPKRYIVKDLSNGMYLRGFEISEDHNRNIGLVQLVKKIEYCLTPFEITEKALERIIKFNISLKNHEIKELEE